MDEPLLAGALCVWKEHDGPPRPGDGLHTDKDFDSLRLRLQSLVRLVFLDWTDFNVANFGNVLVELCRRGNLTACVTKVQTPIDAACCSQRPLRPGSHPST